ncbi:HAMP domain-containing sensor histidine kinase [Alcanivorax sp. 1008]|uniref:sensor histidine kinase n=1 Tax=Alcanivorax sp. 1008 TaxID=2816853 RepID=UPI001D602AFE|nr:HAMP domain-containing sensor histidine kinase [Alcanivorax sp. 1008]MCC1496431.1 HAMP domain-containing histidine kinase [Alcanivorax sp. 1008]
MTALSPTSFRTWRSRLVMLRGMLVVILAIVFIAAWSHSVSPLPVITVLFWLTLLWLPSLLLLFTGKAPERYQHLWLISELTLDVLLFLGFLYQAGGAGNPVIFYLLLPVLVAALSLPVVGNMLIAVLASAGYASTFLWQTGHAHHMHDLQDISNAHGIGMWLIFAMLALVFSLLGQALQRALGQSQRQQATALGIALQRERMYQIAADLADRAHELNTPLATLMLMTEDQPPQDNTQLQEDWQQIHALTERMAALLKAPDNSAAQGQRLLSELVSDLGKNLRILAPGLKVRWHGPDDLPITQTSQWQRVLANLGYNACDAGATTLEIRCEKGIDDYYIQVSDDGPRQHDHDSARQGLGIGLALVETTLAALGGSLELLFDRQWTVARIHLPLSSRGI